MIRIGILALQGAFIEHKKTFDLLGVSSFEIRQEKDLDQDMDGLVLPGGESTAIGKLLHDLNIYAPLVEKITNGLPVLGTCAGMILLAKSISNSKKSHLKTMDITVKSNAYGRQLGSFVTNDLFNNKKIPMTFIRAPYVDSYADDVLVLATVNDRVVAVRQNNQLATSFHPELTNSTYVHQYFLDMVAKRK